MSISLDSVAIVAKKLGPLNEKVVYVGGAVAELYIDDQGGTEVRETEDVDCVVNVVTQTELAIFHDKLRKQGFSEDSDSKVICRWKIGDIKVDVMSQHDSSFGPSNKWYQEGMSILEQRVIASGVKISVFPLPVFLATKFEAHFSRGGKDLRSDSHDLEDIVIVLDGSLDPMPKIKAASSEVKKFLSQSIRKLQKNSTYGEMVDSLLREGPKRVERVRNLLAEIASL